MSAPTSSATIMFPVSCFDQEIRALLEREYDIEFKPQVFGPNFEIETKRLYASMEIDIQEGLLVFSDGEARYGEFAELEEFLVKKGIPFDRESSMDWDRPPVTRVFRPGDPPLDVDIPDDESSGVVVEIKKKIRAVGDKAISEIPILREIMDCIEEVFPTYPSLMDWVKEEATT